MKECSTCREGRCFHEGACQVWIADRYDENVVWLNEPGSAFWYRCECEWGVDPAVIESEYPVTYSRLANR